MKTLFILLSLLSMPAWAVVTKYTVINHSDHSVQCAFAQIANPNPQAPEVTVYHWFVVNNGQSTTFNQRTDGFYCESTDGSNLTYTGNAGYLCVSRSNYVNPLYKANLADLCNSLGGQMVGFINVTGFGAQSTVLNAPN